jgi:hypothetical protein
MNSELLRENCLPIRFHTHHHPTLFFGKIQGLIKSTNMGLTIISNLAVSVDAVKELLVACKAIDSSLN